MNKLLTLVAVLFTITMFPLIGLVLTVSSLVFILVTVIGMATKQEDSHSD